MKIGAFPKIFALGTVYIKDIFDGEVEITEKVDGSQFVMAKIDGELQMRSKGKELYLDSHEKMFDKAVEYSNLIKDKLRENTIYYCEYLNKPKHNCLCYDRTPKNNLILFGVSDTNHNFVHDYDSLKVLADEIDIEVVPLISKLKSVSLDIEEIKKILERTSILGGTKIEGFVVKNYTKTMLIGGQPLPIMCGKFVSEAFKEKHDKDWKKEKTNKGRWQTYLEQFKSQARWEKAIIHLKEKGQIEQSPKDIGKLIEEIKSDIISEEKDNIKEFLYNEFIGQLLANAINGFPQWYKEYLLKEPK